jgi:hypothetical protein
MQLGPVRFTIDARNQAAQRAFYHNLIIRETDIKVDDDNLRIQEIYHQENHLELMIGSNPSS